MDNFAKVTTETHTIVLYHRGCNDGIAAAWAAWRKFGAEAAYIPYQYGEAIPLECDERHVVMVDLSLKEEQLTEMRMRVKSVLIIDHHKTAKDLTFRCPAVKTYDEYMKYRCRAEGDAVIYFDQEWSGAVLTWALFANIKEIHPADVPLPLKIIHDYDLWKHEIPETKAINAWLINGGLSIPRVDELMTQGPTTEMLAVGNALMRYDDKIIKSVIREYVQYCEGPQGEKFVIINAPHHLRNEIADRMTDRFDFVVLYTRRKERIVFSLRSHKNGGYDVSSIAESFGGGGHENAAAFSIPNWHPLAQELGAHLFFRKPKTLLARLSAAWTVLKGVPA